LKTAKAEQSGCGSPRRGTSTDPRFTFRGGRRSGRRWSGGSPPIANPCRRAADRRRRPLRGTAWPAAGRAGEPVTQGKAVIHRVTPERPAPRCSPGTRDGSVDSRPVSGPGGDPSGWHRATEARDRLAWNGGEPPWREARWPIIAADDVTRAVRFPGEIRDPDRSPSRQRFVGCRAGGERAPRMEPGGRVPLAPCASSARRDARSGPSTFRQSILRVGALEGRQIPWEADWMPAGRAGWKGEGPVQATDP
jgi:hypothetical protein